MSEDNIYDLNKGRLKPAAARPEPVIIPKVSPHEAEQIIRGLDEQFVEKVLKKLKDRVEITGSPPWQVTDFSMPIAAQEPGKNLYDYLARVRAELPDKPFADEDSSKDLSAFKQSHGVRQEASRIPGRAV